MAGFTVISSAHKRLNERDEVVHRGAPGRLSGDIDCTSDDVRGLEGVAETARLTIICAYVPIPSRRVRQ